MKRANFSNSNLAGVTLFGADLSEADFTAGYHGATALSPPSSLTPAPGFTLRSSLTCHSSTVDEVTTCGSEQGPVK